MNIIGNPLVDNELNDVILNPSTQSPEGGVGIVEYADCTTADR